MSKDSPGGIISAILSIIPENAREYLGIWVMFLAPMALIFVVVAIPQYIQKATEPSEKCWEIQKIDGQAFKVNTCTGVVEELILPAGKEAQSAPKKLQPTANAPAE